MAASASGAHVKIGTYEFWLEEDLPGHYVYEETTEHIPTDIAGGEGKIDVDQDERLLWRMSDWSGGEGARYYSPGDPTVYSYSEEASNTHNTQGQGANVRRRGQLTGRPDRGRDTITVTDFKKQAFAAVADGVAWVACSKEIAYNDYSTGVAKTWTTQTSGVPSGHSITAVGGSEDWLFYATADSDSRSIWCANTGSTGDDIVADTAFTASDNPWRGRMVMYNGRLYGWTGRKLWEFDVFDGISGTTRTVLTKNANPGYRKVYDTGSNEMTDGNYGGTGNSNWWVDMVASETAIYFMVGNRGQTRIYEFKAGIAKPIWFPPLGFTCKSLCVQNGVLFALGQWGGEVSTSHKGGSAYFMALNTRQTGHLAYFRENVAQSLHMQESASSFGSTFMTAACNTGRVFIYDMDTDGVSMLDKLPYDFNSGAADGKKIGALLSYGEVRIATVHQPRSSSAGTTIEVFAWEKDTEAERASSNTNHDQVVPVFMPWFDFNLPYETKMLYGFHVGYQVEDDSTTSGLYAGQEIELAYAKDNGTYVTVATMTSGTTPSTGVKGRHFMQVSDASSTIKFYQMRYKLIIRGKRSGGVNYQPPIVKDITVEARSLDHDKTWNLIIRLKDDQNQQRLSSEKRFASAARTYLRALKSNKSVVTLLDYYRYQTQHGSAPGTSSSHTVVVHSIRDRIERNGEGFAEVVLKSVKT
jgi:hypothetical protein